MIDKKDIAVKVFFAIVVLLLLTAFFFNSRSSKQCAALCRENNALTSQLLASGSFTAADNCVCYFENTIKTITLP